MRFGKTLRNSTYPPWKDQYIDYTKLKALLRDDKPDDQQEWTAEDESRFCDELLNVQVDKVAKFQEDTVGKLQDRADAIFEKLKDMGNDGSSKPDEGKGKEKEVEHEEAEAERPDIDPEKLKAIQADLDNITNEVRELKKYSNLNYTGFLKIVKKHDRKRGELYKIRPMVQVRLNQRPFNSEQGYSPLLTKLSIMFEAIRQYLHEDEVHHVDLESQPETQNGETYTAHKCQSSCILCDLSVVKLTDLQSGFILTTCLKSRL
jgi:SPX domain protein involved in polyphosphate accumulation